VDLVRGKGVTGGSTYDALVAVTAKHAGVRLLTRDRRATRTYELIGVDFELLR
jgi:predicted nucleic acid-binding protein